MTDKTQALFPVTQEARKASRRFYDETDADLSDATLEKLDAAFARFGFALLDSVGKIDTVDIEGRLEGYTPPESQQDWDCVAALQTIRTQRLRLAATDGRQSHSLPGDVGTDADAQRSIVRAVIDCYNTARPAGLSPVEYVHSKRLVRDAFAALSNVSVQIEQEELLDLIDDAISDSFDEEWNSRMGARHIVGALEHEGWAVVPLAALTPSALSGDAGEGRSCPLDGDPCSNPSCSPGTCFPDSPGRNVPSQQGTEP